MPRQKLATIEPAAASPGEMMTTQARLGVGAGGGGRKVTSGDGRGHIVKVEPIGLAKQVGCGCERK